jgi:hypothetical protein
MLSPGISLRCAERRLFKWRIYWHGMLDCAQILYVLSKIQMSQAFIREGDEQSLSDISPTITALVRFLTMENNGITAYERKTFYDAQGREIHEMNNGLSYFKNDSGRWEVVSETS